MSTTTSHSNSLILITGANQGLGYAAIQTLLSHDQPYTILLGSRSVSRGETAANELLSSHPDTPATIKVLELDLSSDESIKKATEKVEKEYGHLDILINNAGIASASADDSKLSDREILSTIYNTNVFGTYILTTHLLPLLLKSPHPNPRLIFVSSRLGSLSENSLANPDFRPKIPGLESEATVAPLYRTSKTAINGFVVYFDNLKEVRERGVKVLAVCPGYCATNLSGYMGTGSAESGGEIIATAGVGIMKDVEEKSGVFVEVGGTVVEW